MQAIQHSIKTFEKAQKDKNNNCQYQNGYQVPKDRKNKGFTLATGVNNIFIFLNGNYKKIKKTCKTRHNPSYLLVLQLERPLYT